MGKDFKTLDEGIMALNTDVKDQVWRIMNRVKGLTPEMVIQRIIEYNRKRYPDMPDDADGCGFCVNCEMPYDNSEHPQYDELSTPHWTIIIDKEGREKCYECTEFFCVRCDSYLTHLDRKILREEGFGNIEVYEGEAQCGTKRNKKIICAVCRQEESEGLPPNTLPRTP